MEIFWFIPTHGDGRYLGTTSGGRLVDAGYMTQIAQAADQLGYTGVLLPTGRSCEDAWIAAASLIPVTRRLKFLVAVRPGLLAPTLAARMAATFDRLSDGRLLINVVTGGDPEELAGDGLFLDHDDRYEVTREFLTVWRKVMQGETVDFEGRHLRTRGAKILFRPTQTPYPPLYFGGSSPIGQDVAAEHVDVYLTWGEPLEWVAEKIEQVRRKAAERGRELRFGLRLHVIVRETEDEAWADANRLIRYLDEHTISQAQQILARHDSVGQQRMRALHLGDRAKLEIAPNLWAGVGLVRGGAGTALVGDGPTVAKRLKEYAALGIDTFILSGYPHLEEAYRVAELLFPHLPIQQPRRTEALLVSPFGEIIANDRPPSDLGRGKAVGV